MARAVRRDGDKPKVNRRRERNLRDFPEDTQRFDEARQWIVNYMNSPQYQRMLAESGERGNQDISAIDAMRRERIASLPEPEYETQEDASASYNPGFHRMVLGPGETTDVPLHELSHVQDLIFNRRKRDRLGLPQADVDMIMSMTNPVFRDFIEKDISRNSRDWSRTPSGRLSDINVDEDPRLKELMDYMREGVEGGFIDERGAFDKLATNAAPYEVRARLNAARYMAQKEGIYDPFTQTPTMDDVKELLRLYDSDPKKYFQLKWMKAYQSPEQILQLLQSVSDNPNTQQEQYPRA
jgi:hypothetical protein